MSATDAALQDLEASLFGSIDRSPIATVITDPRRPDNPIVATNTAFSRLTGYSAEEIIGRNCRFLAGPETDPRGSAVLREAVGAYRAEQSKQGIERYFGLWSRHGSTQDGLAYERRLRGEWERDVPLKPGTPGA